MPPTPPAQRMGELHERELAEVFGGTKTKASGSQWTDPADGANHHDLPFSYRWDGKSTKAKSLTITLAMIEKIIEQAGGERPAIGLRFYGNEALTQVLADWSAMQNADVAELLEAGRRTAALEAELDQARKQAEALMKQRESLQEALQEAQEELAATSMEFARRGAAADASGALRPAPEHVPMLPWTIVYQTHGPDGVRNRCTYYAPSGIVTHPVVETVVVERSQDSANRPRLILNGTRIRHGDLYVDGHLTTRVAQTIPGIEVG